MTIQEQLEAKKEELRALREDKFTEKVIKKSDGTFDDAELVFTIEESTVLVDLFKANKKWDVGVGQSVVELQEIFNGS